MLGQTNKLISNYQQFYKKRLNTESFVSPSLKDYFFNLSYKIQSQIQNVKKNNRLKNLKIFKARSNLNTIQDQEKNHREQLRIKIQEKLQLSEANLEKIMVQKRSRSKSKDQLRQTTISRIKNIEKTQLEESFRKSSNISKNTEQFFQSKHEHQNMTRATSFLQNSTKTKYSAAKQKINVSISLHQAKKHVLPHVLKIDDKTLQEKQFKKTYLSKKKQAQNIEQIVRKFKQIELKRQVRGKKLKDSISSLQKQRAFAQQKLAQRNRNRSQLSVKHSSKRKQYEQKRQNRLRYQFSQQYEKRLEQKRAIKDFDREEAFKQGNEVLERSMYKKQERKHNEIINDTIKEFQKYYNFKNKQKWNQSLLIHSIKKN